MSEEFYRVVEKILVMLMVGGGAAVGVRYGTAPATDEITKLRVVVEQAISRVESVEMRTTKLESAFHSRHEDGP